MKNISIIICTMLLSLVSQFALAFACDTTTPDTVKYTVEPYEFRTMSVTVDSHETIFSNYPPKLFVLKGGEAASECNVSGYGTTEDTKTSWSFVCDVDVSKQKDWLVAFTYRPEGYIVDMVACTKVVSE